MSDIKIFLRSLKQATIALFYTSCTNTVILHSSPCNQCIWDSVAK